MFQISSNIHPSFDQIFCEESAAPSDQTEICPVTALTADLLGGWLEDQDETKKAWVEANKFKASAGQVLLVPNNMGRIERVLLGLGDDPSPLPYITGALPQALPEGIYKFDTQSSLPEYLAMLGWAMGHYSFSVYKSSNGDAANARLVPNEAVNMQDLQATIEGIFAVRDLVNIPANDMGPDNLEQAAHALCEKHKGSISVIRGDELISQNFPLIHAVGKAAEQAPRLIDLQFGAPDLPKLTLVGKGVCFDTGGLNLKTSSAMGLMKKDMGGAAHVLGLAHLILSSKLSVRLRVLIPAVENSVSGQSFRPGDVYPSRKGHTVEIGNTDAEGRLILADALAFASEDDPDLLIDMATLTGAARAALGPDLPPFYTASAELAGELTACSIAEQDPLWQMPLWSGYNDWIDSQIAAVNHISSQPFAGSITAALFLQKFVDDPQKWIHFDIYAWCPKAKPGQPVGGEAQCVRALFRLFNERYGR